MAILSNPFVMEVPRKLTDRELANAIRQDLVGELLELLERLCPDEKGLHDEGREEVRELLGDKKGK